MTRTGGRSAAAVFILGVGGVAWSALGLSGQSGRGAAAAVSGTFVASTRNGDWPSYGRYARHALFTARPDHRRKLQRPGSRRRFKTDNLGTVELSWKALRWWSTVSYARRQATDVRLSQLDRATGELLWVHRYPEGTRGANAPRQLSRGSHAGLTAGRRSHHLFHAGLPAMIALDARTGQPVKTFGKDGIVDLKAGAVFGKDQPIDLETGRSASTRLLSS